MDTDILIIGGGINGAGIAADAAGRGLSVILCEQNDLASGTSWKSSKLIHGGLRYLEYHEFRLVREALQEREILRQKAPHIISPLSFVMPDSPKMRPAWLIRLGLFLYDHLRKTRLPKSQHINLANHPAGQPLKPNYKSAFLYSDCYVDDSRLVILNAIQAQQKGAIILPRWKMIAGKRYSNHWQVTIQNTDKQTRQIINARALVNAAGPWVDNVLENLATPAMNSLALVKGSHIVVSKLYNNTQAYLLQNSDKRVIFVIPFEEDYSLIGTTDISFDGNLNDITISNAEIDYLLHAVNSYFKQNITPENIVWSYAGVRALKRDDADNPAAITRDYALELNATTQQAPLLSIFGGKITTYRTLAEHALALLNPYFPNAGAPWTATTPLPGGDIPEGDLVKFQQQLLIEYPWLPLPLCHRYSKSYGTLTSTLLNNMRSIGDLGTHFGAGLYTAEINYLMQHEWAQTVEDILWRRSKLGLNLFPAAVAKLTNYLI